jgi:hypothetical protein
MMNEPYTRAELEKIKEIIDRTGYAIPERGQFCPRCKCYLPEYAELSKEVEANLRARLAKGTPLNLISKEFQEITGCPQLWIKIWLLHPNGPESPGAPDLPPKPCPYCGEILRTPKAQQCFQCGADWHGDYKER